MSLYHRPAKKTDEGQLKEDQELIPEYNDFHDCIKKEMATMSFIFKTLLIFGLLLGLFFYSACQLGFKIWTICSTHPFEVFVLIFLSCSILFILLFAAFMRY